MPTRRPFPKRHTPSTSRCASAATLALTSSVAPSSCACSQVPSAMMRASSSAAFMRLIANGVTTKVTAMLLRNIERNQDKPMKHARSVLGRTTPTRNNKASARRRGKWTCSRAMSTRYIPTTSMDIQFQYAPAMYSELPMPKIGMKTMGSNAVMYTGITSKIQKQAHIAVRPNMLFAWGCACMGCATRSVSKAPTPSTKPANCCNFHNPQQHGRAESKSKVIGIVAAYRSSPSSVGKVLARCGCKLLPAAFSLLPATSMSEFSRGRTMSANASSSPPTPLPVLRLCVRMRPWPSSSGQLLARCKVPNILPARTSREPAGGLPCASTSPTSPPP
mmetsp:Transcript_22638/g.64249  ORF Transcript_22638/g.64249 Transcript_22638/m.64249 type:complete len:333 (-) Transcript_22638:21-1019(-)